MKSDSFSQQKAQLDKAERERLETVVEKLRSRVEDNVRFQLTQKGMDDEPGDRDSLDDDRKKLADAIDLEKTDGHSWKEAFDEYTAGVGYTIVNRLAALRCMEVRDFIDEEVTIFKENGLTPAAETLVNEKFLLENEAILTAYHNACNKLTDEIDILFNLSSTYSLIDPDDDTFKQLCTILNRIPDQIWRADDVLGWVYEYYNRPIVEALDAKNTLEPEDVGPANQFYTPHWVVRMLADNSLGKLYIESTEREIKQKTEQLSIEERKTRPVTPESASNVPELCTYLIDDKTNQDVSSFDHPSELQVIDPACGSGHFLLYAFDILERIWWAETDLNRSEIPEKILEYNLYGVDIDLRSCQLSAFNLYLKARTRAEEEGSKQFEMPNLDIVCADARVAEVEEATNILDQITGKRTDLREALGEIIEEFQTTEALGSLLDVQTALEAEFESGQTDIVADWERNEPLTLNSFLRALREAVEERTSDSFGEQNLRSLLNLLVVLTRDYDVCLMNPPYGSGGRMPDGVQEYVDSNYEYTTEYYINFFEACDRLVTTGGRIGMLIPWSFMFNKSFQDFREDFVGGRGSFDFFSEFGYDILDNATVGTVGTVVRSKADTGQTGTFIRLPDIQKKNKEQMFLEASFDDVQTDVQRLYQRELSEFEMVPGTPLSYWVPPELRELYESEIVLDADNAGLQDRETLGDIKQGTATADDSRFVHNFWENIDNSNWAPFAKGGADAWLLPRIKNTLLWGNDGTEVSRYPKSYPRNTQYYFNESLSYTVAKRSGRRFGYLHNSSVFGHKGSVLVPDRAIWNALSYTNSHLFTYLMLTQTSERMWEVGFVSKVPWRNELENIDKLEDLSREAVGHVVSKRQYDFVSPHYDGPVLLDVLGIHDPLPQYNHPHRELRDSLKLNDPKNTVSNSSSLHDMGVAATRHLERIQADLQDCADAIDNAVFECFDIDPEQRDTVIQEIALRTIEDPRDREEYDPETVTEPSEKFPDMVKDLLLHLTIRVVHEDEDGIVPLSDVEVEDGLISRIEDEFDRIFGGYASTRLAEVDQLLGSQSAGKEAYPNLRDWLENDLFDYHVSTFDRTPILWRFTTERLVSDPEGEGFACLVDYHQLDSGVFDRLQNRYLEPRKALLREQRSAANRRSSDKSLSASEKAAAAKEQSRCESGLEQIDTFEKRLSELAQPTPREWSRKNQQTAKNASRKVDEFKKETASHLETLEKLAELDGVDMEDLFSPSFYETVQENRNEWLDALDELETALEAYSNDSSQSVEAHLYDLLGYYDELVGSSHYASNGILFMTYYFDKFEKPDQARLNSSGVSDVQRFLSELAVGIENYQELAKEISNACDKLSSGISSEWEDRALSEIMTEGYQPNHKYGVEINIKPLAQAEIVPKTVEDKIL